MNTSYFSRNHNHPHAVSIAGGAPKWYIGREYKKLSPKYWFFQKYKEDGDEEFYTEAYYQEVLGDLDAQEVYDALGGDDAVMLCWEASNKFCHRHIVAEWFKDELGVTVEEL